MLGTPIYADSSIRWMHHPFDASKYSWRGEMLDTSRHFVAVFDILRFIDGLYAAKMNVFHWHIVDAPSFPMVRQLRHHFGPLRWT